MLELKNISKRYENYPDSRFLADQLNLSVLRGEIVALLGASGAGKSTLLKIVAGLEQADAGQVFFDLQDITQLPPEKRHFALMFQDFALFPHLNVLDNVAFGLIEQKLNKKTAREQALAMLERFDLATHAYDKVTTLSGGEQQRVALARALITQPKVLLLDEPFSALDAELRQSLRDEFKQHLTNMGISTLMVTHDELEARAMSSRGVRLVMGQLSPAW
jgi:ABC-type Fe3+/spermidine/putrescine transport system ATPase subunit